MASLVLKNETQGGDYLNEFIALFPDEREVILKGFLDNKKNDFDRAVKHYQLYRDWRQKLGKISIADVAPFIRSPGSMIILENAKTVDGSTIAFCKGMIFGSKADMTKQIVYFIEHFLDTSSTNQLFLVFQALNKTFRFPDRNYRHAVFDTLQNYYPYLDGTVLFMNLPRVMRYSFNFLKKFLKAEAVERMKFVR